MAKFGVITTTERDARRFWAKVALTSTGCLEWTGSISPAGYGNFRATCDGRQRSVHAHRVSFALIHGATPALDIDHLCRNKRCVAPDHLEPVSSRENTARSSSFMAQVLRAWDSGRCAHGHVIAEVGIEYLGPKRVRRCSACHAGPRRPKRTAP